MELRWIYSLDYSNLSAKTGSMIYQLHKVIVTKIIIIGNVLLLVHLLGSSLDNRLLLLTSVHALLSLLLVRQSIQSSRCLSNLVKGHGLANVSSQVSSKVGVVQVRHLVKLLEKRSQGLSQIFKISLGLRLEDSQIGQFGRSPGRVGANRCLSSCSLLRMKIDLTEQRGSIVQV